MPFPRLPLWAVPGAALMATRISRYDIAAKLLLQLEDGPLIDLGRGVIKYPYDVRQTIPQFLRDLANELEEAADES